jgi:hypothetical protein
VQKGEPDRLLPIGIIYYTASVLICKYSIVTKIGKKICEKTYELEFLRILRALFCELFPWTFLSWFFEMKKKAGGGRKKKKRVAFCTLQMMGKVLYC